MPTTERRHDGRKQRCTNLNGHHHHALMLFAWVLYWHLINLTVIRNQMMLKKRNGGAVNGGPGKEYIR